MPPVHRADNAAKKGPSATATKLERMAWTMTAILALATALLAGYTAAKGYFSLDYSQIGQQVVVDDGVDPVVDFARFTCPVRYQYLRLVADNAARAAEVEAETATTTEATDEEEATSSSANSANANGILKAERLKKQLKQQKKKQQQHKPSAGERHSLELKSLLSGDGADGSSGDQQQLSAAKLARQSSREEPAAARKLLLGGARVPDKGNRIVNAPSAPLNKLNGLSEAKVMAKVVGNTEEKGDGKAANGDAASGAHNADAKVTITESFAYHFMHKCQLQSASPFKNASRGGREEMLFYWNVFDILFNRTGGFHFYKDSAEVRAANVTESDIWWTMGQLNRRLFTSSSPFFLQLATNALKQERLLNIQQINFDIPELYLDPMLLELYGDKLANTYAVYLSYYAKLLDITSSLDNDGWDKALHDIVHFQFDLHSMKEPTKVVKRKFSEAQKAAVPEHKNQTYTLAQLQTRFPHINWAALVDGFGLLEEGNEPPPKFFVDCPTYLGRLDAYFGNQTNRQEVWHKMINSMLASAAQLIMQIKYTDCTNLLDTYLPDVNGYAYVNSFSRKERETKIYEIEQIVKPIVKEYGAAIEDSDWMTQRSKQKALEKLRALVVNLGWPYFYGLDEPIDYDANGVANNASIDKLQMPYFSTFYHFGQNMTYETSEQFDWGTGITAEEFDKNEALFMRILLTFVAIQNKRTFEKLGQKADRRQGMAPNELNAYYDPTLNALSISYAWLRQNFDPEQLVESYGKIGTTIAHEIGHGFDPTGIQYGKDGTLEQILDEESAKGYDKIQQCVVERFAKCCPAEAQNFSIPCVDGWNTQGENFADISGLAISYRAFMRRQSLLHGGQIQLAKRKFWVSFGFKWCQVLPVDEDTLRLIMTDVHSPNECRARVATGSIPQFYRDFGVEPPLAKRCNLWEPKPRRQ